MKRIIAVLCVLLLVLAGCGSSEEGNPSSSNSSGSSKKKITVIDLSSMTQEEIQEWADENNVKVKFDQAYSNDVEDGGFVSQSKESDKMINEGDTITIIYSLGEEPPKEFQNALKKAQSYSELMHMSKARIYNQLTSEYGEKFPAEAAEWAVEHLKADYNYNALKMAETYSETMHMSKARIYDQLTSEYGEDFTDEEAQYAIDNLVADFNENALLTAKNYQEVMSMSKAAIYDQLVSQYGEQFTPEEAQYAVDHLDGWLRKHIILDEALAAELFLFLPKYEIILISRE